MREREYMRVLPDRAAELEADGFRRVAETTFSGDLGSEVLLVREVRDDRAGGDEVGEVEA